MGNTSTVSQTGQLAPRRRAPFMRWLFDVRAAGVTFPLAILIGYCFVPVVVQTWFYDYAYLDSLAMLAFVSAACIMFAALTPFLDPIIASHHRRIALNERTFQRLVWGTFLAFAILAWVTAERIPILAAISGADPATLAELRERFLKAREGWQQSFVYINALYTGALLPYCVAKMFVSRSRGRWIGLLFFFIYSISFLEKAFFLKALIPLFYLIVTRKIKSKISPTLMVLVLIGMVVFMAIVSGAGESDVVSTANFFSPQFVPDSPIQHMAWRIIAIPVITAADGLRLFATEFAGQSLDGATSSLLAAISAQVRIPFEQLVFALQWGQNETGTGSANSVFIVEAYVNFGILGVIFFSLLVGTLLRLFAKSNDTAAGACWLLFALGLYTAGLIGVLLSNGFIFLFLLILFVRFRTTRKAGNV